MLSAEIKIGVSPDQSVLALKAKTIKVGEIVETHLPPEELAKIDAEVDKAMSKDWEELKEMKKHLNRPDWRTFTQPMTF